MMPKIVTTVRLGESRNPSGDSDDARTDDDAPHAISLEPYNVENLYFRRDDFGSFCCTPNLPSQALSLFLLDLYGLANSSGIGEFEKGFFHSLSSVIPFSAGWTGVSSRVDSGPVIRNSFFYGLPSDFYTDWTAVRDCDPFARRPDGVYSEASYVSLGNDEIPPRFREWGIKYGISYMLFVCALDQRTGLTAFLEIYRSQEDKPFSEEDVVMIENIIPHLSAALALNHTIYLSRGNPTSNIAIPARALCDRFGAIHQSDKGFETIVQREWRDFNGRQLPSALLCYLNANFRNPYVGSRLHLTGAPIGGLFQLEARPRSSVDVLSPRELAALRLFGEGLSHKKVAQQMDLSPTTVRHYLRCAYRKLGMHDKSQIPRLLSECEQVEDWNANLATLATV